MSISAPTAPITIAIAVAPSSSSSNPSSARKPPCKNSWTSFETQALKVLKAENGESMYQKKQPRLLFRASPVTRKKLKVETWPTGLLTSDLCFVDFNFLFSQFLRLLVAPAGRPDNSPGQGPPPATRETWPKIKSLFPHRGESHHASGFFHFNPGKRAKSASVVWRIRPRSIAKAARWVSVVKFPAVPICCSKADQF